MKPMEILLCMGTRPEIIKMAPVYHALNAAGLSPLVLHTGQHEEVADQLYPFLEMEPAHRLEMRRENSALAHLTAEMHKRIDPLLETIRPRAVLVQGDTTSALVAALAAFYHRIPVGHIEAGLRSHDRDEPFPEEKNRELIARIARWHFAPTPRAVANLHREGVEGADVFQVGNTVVDAARWAAERLEVYLERTHRLSTYPLRQIVERGRVPRLLLVTAHRRENWTDRIAEVARAVATLLADRDDVLVLWPLHPNPDIQKTVRGTLDRLTPRAAQRLLLSPPLNYPEMLWALSRSWLVLTDSGGVQEEALTCRVPALVLRRCTERPEILETGAGVLVGTSAEAIRDWVLRLLEDDRLYASMRCETNPFGDGQAGRRIATILARELGAGGKHEPRSANATHRP